MPVMDGYDTIRAIRAIERFTDASHHRRHRQGHGRRATALHRCRGQRLRPQADRHGRAPHRPESVAPGALGVVPRLRLPGRRRPPPPGASPSDRWVRCSGHGPDRISPGPVAAGGRRQRRAQDPGGRRRLPQYRSPCRHSSSAATPIVVVAQSGAEALAAAGANSGLRRRPDGHHDAGHGRLRRPSVPSGPLERFTTLPIIAVTGKVHGRRTQRCIEAGANDYVPKPVDSAELLAALRPWLPTTIQPAAA